MWPLRRADDESVARLAAESGISPALARVLWLRGVRDAAGVEAWLRPAIRHLHQPQLLPDFTAATQRVQTAIGRGEGILVWGHDDLDGITATVILLRVLSDLRGTAHYYIPTKGRERHGLNPDLVAGHRQKGVGLVVTVDCGITNRQQVACLKAQGVDVVVTDHHEPLDALPDAVANVDPKRSDSNYPYRGLAGAGVALKLAMGLAGQVLGLSVEQFLSVQQQMMAVAILGTLADRVPLTGENRTLVALGLRSLETSTVPAIAAVRERLSSDPRLDPTRFVPDLLSLFAAADGNEGVERMLSSSPDQARAWVADLAARSDAWRAEAERTFERAEKIAMVGDGIVFVRGADLGLRTLGSCAARLKDRYQLPVVVMGWRGDAWVGECRSVDGANLMDLLKAHARFFIDYGGHRKAAGFSIVDEKVADFIRSAELFAHEHFAGHIEPENSLQADALLPLRQFDFDYGRLAPFGEGNRYPVFVAPGERLARVGQGWVPQSRPDLQLRAQRHEPVGIAGNAVDVLYSVDDSGQPVLLDARPAEEH